MWIWHLVICADVQKDIVAKTAKEVDALCSMSSKISNNIVQTCCILVLEQTRAMKIFADFIILKRRRKETFRLNQKMVHSIITQ